MTDHSRAFVAGCRVRNFAVELRLFLVISCTPSPVSVAYTSRLFTVQFAFLGFGFPISSVLGGVERLVEFSEIGIKLFCRVGGLTSVVTSILWPRDFASTDLLKPWSDSCLHKTPEKLSRCLELESRCSGISSTAPIGVISCQYCLGSVKITAKEAAILGVRLVLV